MPGRRALAPLRLAAVAAFPFPLSQGSQIFARDQLRALARAGADVTLICYGSGAADEPACDDIACERTPRALSPRALRAGPRLLKPLADAALLATCLGAQRRRRFQALLAHNGEAAVAALAVRALTRVPVVYVAHTLLGRELASYAPLRLGPALDRIGGALDRAIARQADAVIALTGPAARALGPHARGPVEVIPPGATPAAPPDDARVAEACARAGLERGRFALYAGNLDGYQDLAVLEGAARRLPQLAIAVATHAPPPRATGALRTFRVRDHAEVRALAAGAALALLPRRRPGGFPIKLLSYMQAGRAIVASAGIVDELVHDRSAWLLPPDATAEDWADAIAALAADGARARRLGDEARALLASHHAWPQLAARTLTLTERVVRAPSAARASGSPEASC